MRPIVILWVTAAIERDSLGVFGFFEIWEFKDVRKEDIVIEGILSYNKEVFESSLQSIRRARISKHFSKINENYRLIMIDPHAIFSAPVYFLWSFSTFNRFDC